MDTSKLLEISFITTNKHIIFILLQFFTFLCFSFPYYSLDVCIYGIRRENEIPANFENELIIAEYIANIITPLMAGFITDYAGARYVLFTSNILSIFSQLIIFFWEKFDYVSYEYLLMGRILYVLCFESFFVASISLLNRWCVKHSFSKAVNLSLILGEGFIYIIIYIISYYYSSHLYNEDYLYYIILFGTILAFLSLPLNFYMLFLYKNIEYDQLMNPKQLNSLWKSFQNVLNFKFFCIIMNFGLISSSFNWFVQYYDEYLALIFFKENDEYYYLATSQVFEVIPYAVLTITAIFMAFTLTENSYRILYLILGSLFMLFGQFYFYYSKHYKEAEDRFKWILTSFSVVSLSLGYSIHYSIIYTCIPFLNYTRGNHVKNTKEIGLKFGIMRWIRSIINFFMFVAISGFEYKFDKYWISSLFIVIGILLYCCLIGVYDKKLFRIKDLNAVDMKKEERMLELMKENSEEKKETEENVGN